MILAHVEVGRNIRSVMEDEMKKQGSKEVKNKFLLSLRGVVHNDDQ